MAKRKSHKPKEDTKTSFMFPSLHQRVLDAISDQAVSARFDEKTTNQSNNKYSTNITGKFKCSNKDCSKGGWSSKKVSILIRGYPGNGYNALVFNQRCQSCNKLGILTLDENSYVERVAYRLKKWAGVRTEEQPYEQNAGPPHKSELCEGCKQGYCQKRNYWED
ncbi:zinc-binding domain-containing protein [Daldinia decipiens]|uniref:zinc-binding domain-containing protein n=1 Tax=Daldinia decipiens TaxID=326647 RepID=UPI0020C4379C|nr:zinc-binding domain-containing protein [Daldinia decipiens]KAI1653496.1 zinc-binding domain-containing protein [Daldinia decipiens]